MTVKKVKGGYRASWTDKELGYCGATDLYIPQETWDALVAHMTTPHLVARKALWAAQGHESTNGINKLRYKITYNRGK